ncbi:hypothetical protein ABZP36_027323 [Zizania latifolia]
MAMVMTRPSSGSGACRRTTELSSWWRLPRATTAVALTKKPCVRWCWSLSSSLHDGDGGGGGGGREVVDEGMPVLWRRILEMKAAAAEQQVEEELITPPEGWEEEHTTTIWEPVAPPEEWRGGGQRQRQQHGGGGVDGQLFHVLRGFLMSSQPAVAAGIVVFLVLSVPASVFLAVCSRLLVEWRRLLFTLTKH